MPPLSPRSPRYGMDEMMERAREVSATRTPKAVSLSGDVPFKQESFMKQADLLDETEAACFLTIKPPTLAAWRYRGVGPDFLKIGRLIRYRRSALEDFLSKQKRQSTSGNRQMAKSNVDE